MPTDAAKGRIILTACILCGCCGGWNDLQARRLREAAKEAKRRGFRFTRAAGWTCPGCIHFRECPECNRPGGYCMTGHQIQQEYGGGRPDRDNSE